METPESDTNDESTFWAIPTQTKELLCDGCNQLRAVHLFSPTSHVFTELNTIRRYYLGLGVIINPSGGHACMMCYKDCLAMRRAIGRVCTRRGAPLSLPHSSQLPAPCSTSSTSPGLRSSKKRRQSELSQETFPSLEHSEVEHVPELVERVLFHKPDSTSVPTQTDTVLANTNAPPHVRVTVAKMIAQKNVSANQAMPVYHMCTGVSEDADVLSRNSSQRFLLEASLCAFELFVLEGLNGHHDICLGLDGSNTYFGRNVVELHASGHSSTELLGLLDSVDKSAQASLDDIFLVLERVNAVERRFNVPQTPLYHFTSLTCDTTSSMSGHIGGLQALLEKARHKAWTGDGCPGVYKPLTFKQCDDHVCNLPPYMSGDMDYVYTP
jgi:hypothetical protein